MAHDPAVANNDTTGAGWNWARTHRFTASRLERPTSIEQLQRAIEAAVAGEKTIRCVGSRHSFTDIADAAVLLDLFHMPERFEVAADQASVTVNGSMIYSRLAELLAPTGRAVANLASLPHISIAGATATGTHGSGDGNGNVATSVIAVQVAGPNGELRRIGRGDEDFAAAPISLGALGVIVAVELDLVPSFLVRQLVHNFLSWEVLQKQFDELFASTYSVSVFTDWIDHIQLWTKERTDEDPVDHAALHDGVAAIEQLHPIPGVSAEACTDQGEKPGRWDERLPHFRAGAVPSAGAEVQSEFFVARSHAVDAMAALRTIGEQLAPHLMISEIRTVRSDGLWLSPQYERDCVGFHFTWHHDMDAALHAGRLVADTLTPFSPLPHWGKVFDPSQFTFPALYPKLTEAHRVFTAADPSGTFRNRWMDATFG